MNHTEPLQKLRLQHHLFVFLVGIVVFFVQGPEFVMHLWSRLPDGGDSFINSWILSWNAHALFKPGVSVWDAPIFYPLQYALAFSEAMFGNLWLTLPVQFLTGNPTLASNTLLLASFILCTYCVFLLVHDLTGNYWAGLVAGLIFSFNPYRWGHLAHLQLLPVFWSVIAVLLFNRFLRNSRPITFFGMMIAIWIQYYASVYLGTMLLTFLVLLFLIHVIGECRGRERRVYVTEPRYLKLFIIGLILSIIILLPLGLPYLKTAKTWNVARTLSENAAWSAEPLSLFLRPSWGAANHLWMKKVFPGQLQATEGAVFVGFMPLLLAVLAAFWIWRGSATFSEEQRVVFRRYIWAALITGIFMLGPYLIWFKQNTGVPLPYQLVYYLVPGAKALRVPARFAQLYLLCLAVMAGYAIAAYFSLSKRWPVVVKIFIALIFVALLSFDYGVRPRKGIRAELQADFPPVYHYLAKGDITRPILELPAGHSYPPPTWAAFKYLHYQNSHWRPALGGMSGWFPPGRQELNLQLDDEVSDESLELIGLTPASTLVVHLKEYKKKDRRKWLKANLKPYGFSFAGRFGDSLVWERGNDSPPLSDKLAILWTNSFIKGGKLRTIAFFKPAQTEKPWRYLTKGWSELNVEITDSDGRTSRHKTTFNIPPYILPGKFVRSKFEKIKVDEKYIKTIRITGPLIAEYDQDLTAAVDGYELQMENGKYKIVLDGTAMKLSKNDGHSDQIDTFGLTFLGNEHVVIQSVDGLFASAEEGGGKDFNVNRHQIGPWEIFEVVHLDNEQIALKSVEGWYVSAKGGTVKATATKIRKWEKFRLIKKNRPINRLNHHDS